jgi:SNF2 family DNA or RNA helicase
MTQLWSHQRDAVDFARDLPATLLGLGLGCGKSAVALALNDLWQCERTLIICPTAVRAVWRRECAKHMTRDAEVIVLDSGTILQRTRRAYQTCRNSRRPVVVVMNYEAAWRFPFHDWALSFTWDLVILDESQRVMRESQTSNFCARLRDHATRRLCLSGTPLTQDPIGVWAQCRFLDPSVFGEDLKAFKDIYHARHDLEARKELAKFREKWGNDPIALNNPRAAAMLNYADEKLPGTLKTREYLRKLASIAFRVENVVLDLPPLTVERRTFQLSSEARAIYDAIESGHSRKIETGDWGETEPDSEIAAQLRKIGSGLRDLDRLIEKMMGDGGVRKVEAEWWPETRGSLAIPMRLQQVTSGWLPDKAGKIRWIDLGKARCLKDLLTEAAGEPVVVFCRFVHDLDMGREIAKRLCLQYGEISQRRKDGINNMATMTEGLQVVGVQEQAGGSGIDLSLSRIAVRYSPSWSVANSDQSLARVYRPPQAHPVIVYELAAEGTIDEEVYRAVAARKGIVGQVWGDLRRTPLASSPSRGPASCMDRC